MTLSKAKICMLIMGGSTINHVNELGFQFASEVDRIEQNFPELRLIAGVDIEILNRENSTSIVPEQHWPLLAAAIVKNYNDYDGFVVIHGKDTVLSTASGIAFMLQNLNKPIVFTTASYHANHHVLQPKYHQIIHNSLTADTRLNIINAVLVAMVDMAEVAVVFGEDILRATCAKRYHELDRNIFHTFNIPPLGVVETQPKIYSHTRRKQTKSEPLKYHNGFEWNVAVLQTYQGMQIKLLEMLYESGTRGFVINGFGIGSVPEGIYNNWMPGLEKLLAAGVPIVFVSSSPDGLVDLELYEYQRKLHEKGLISGSTMTTDAAYAKLMWAMAQSGDLKAIQMIMETDIIGERPTV